MTYIPVAEQKAIADKAAEDKRTALNALFAKNRIFAFNCGLRRDPLYPEVREANPLQKQLIAAWENPQYKVFTYSGGNRLGKCLTYSTLVDTPKGEISVGELFESGRPFEVYAWNGKEKVVAKAEAPFKKEGSHKCFEIVMSDGRTIRAADHHRILCMDGQFRHVSEIYAQYGRFINEKLSFLNATGITLFFRQFPVTFGSNITRITPLIHYQEVYDFEVETYHNYFAGGLIHHNTTSGAIIAIATVAGEWPWSGKKLKYMHDKPRKVRYVGQGWEQHVKAVVEPALKFWWPESYIVKKKKNNQGIDATWELWSRDHKKGLLGTIEIMSNVQDSAVFEGWEGDLIIYDEPPRRDVRVACARGLVDREGRELFCMTLLGEAWIHREVIKAKLPDGSPDMTVFNINGESKDNVGYGITQAGLDQFAKTLKPEEVEARIKGKPSYLSSLLCPRFDIHLHVKERFTAPLDALIDISIDWHPSKPLAVVFLATLKNGVKYIVDEIKFRGPTKSAAEEIVRIIRMRDYARVNRIVIDPLSKSGEPNDTDAYTIFSDTLAPYGYTLDVASKDKENGIEMLNGLLWTENEAPALFFFKDCVNSIQEIEDMMYDPETFKPVKVNDDYFECIYRLCLMDTQWFPVYQSKSSGSHNVVL